jgi:hypothetical protein
VKRPKCRCSASFPPRALVIRTGQRPNKRNRAGARSSHCDMSEKKGSLVARRPFSRELQPTRIIALGKRQGALKAVPDPNLRNWSAHLIDGRKRQWRVTSRPPLSRRRSRPPASSSGWKTSGASAWRPTYGADAPRTEDRGRRPNAEDTARLIGTGSKSASTPSAPRSTPRSLVCGDTPSANRYWHGLFDFSMCASFICYSFTRFK